MQIFVSVNIHDVKITALKQHVLLYSLITLAINNGVVLTMSANSRAAFIVLLTHLLNKTLQYKQSFNCLYTLIKLCTCKIFYSNSA